MDNLKRLFRDHAYWADERKRLKREGEEAAEKCERVQQAVQAVTLKNLAAISSTENCISYVFSEVRELNRDCPPFDDGYSYEEVWHNLLAEGEVCEHCQRVRELKKQRMYAGTRLGAVRAAITRVGRKLQSEAPEQ